MLVKKSGGSLFSDIIEYFKNIPYMVAVLITTISSYLFFVTHFSVSIDDLSRERYILDGYIAAQGRFSGSIVACVFDLFDVDTGLMEMLGVFFLLISAMVFCVCFDKLYKTENKIPQILFSCFLITYPLHAEVFVYTGCTLSVGFGFFLVSISLWIIENSLETAGDEKFGFKSIKKFILPTLFLIFVTSWYESVLCVYFGAVFSIIILKMFSNHDKKEFNFIRFIKYGLHFAIPLVMAVIIEYLIQKTVLAVVDLKFQNFADNTIVSLGEVTLNRIWSMIVGSVLAWVIPALYYYPITVFLVSVVVCFIAFIVVTLIKKDFKFFIAFIGLLLSTVVLAVIRLDAVAYRTAQPMAYFVAFTAFILLVFISEKKNKHFFVIKRIVVVLLIVVCINQISELNYWFNAEEIRYQNEKATLEQISYKLNSEYDIDKPIVFVGKYSLPQNVEEKIMLQEDTLSYKLLRIIGKVIDSEELCTNRQLTQTICNSYISWGIQAFGEVNTELLKFFSYLGYDYIQGTKEMYEDALIKAENKPAWPENGSISDEDEYILVNFGIELAKAE